MKILLLLTAIFIFAVKTHGRAYQSGDNSHTSLSVDKALSIAIKNSPKIKAIKKEIIAKKLSGQSDSLYPNPEIEIEVSDFLGTSGYSGFSNSGLSLNLSQEIVLGGKNSKLIKLTDSEISIIKLEIKKEKINLKYKIKKLFIEVSTMKKFYKLSIENQKISLEILETVRNKKEFGAISELEVLKSQIEYKSSEIELKKEEDSIKSVKKLLFELMGSDTKWIIQDIMIERHGRASQPEEKEPIQVEIGKAILESKKKELIIEKSKKIPNLSLTLGANRYQEFGDYSFTMAVSIPIPIWNSNSVKVKSIYFEIEKNKEEIRASKKEINQELLGYYQNLKIAKNELDGTKNDILPLAEKSLNLAKEGYKEGEFKYLEFLDAKKTFILMKRQYIEVLSRYNLLNLEIEHILGEIK